MSAEALGCVFRCSPYPGASASSAALIAIADTVSDVHGNEFWMSQDELSQKARISVRRLRGALAQLAADGWIEELRPATNRDPARYVFHLDAPDGKPAREVQWEARAIRDRRAAEAAGAVDNADSGPDAASAQADAGPDAASGRGGRSDRSRADAASAEPKSNPSQLNACRPRAVPAVDNPDPLDGDWPPLLEAIATRLDRHHADRLAGETHERLHSLQVVLQHLLAEGWTPKRIAERLTRAPLVGEITSVAAVLASRAVEAREADRRRAGARSEADEIPPSVLLELQGRADVAVAEDAGGVDVARRHKVLEELKAAWLAERRAAS